MRSGSALITFGAAALLAAGSPAMPLAQPARAPTLGSAASFVIHGSTSVTNTGSSRVTGNVGVSPGNVATGFSTGMFSAGDVHRDDALARAARIDGTAAADDLFRQRCGERLDGENLGGRTLRGGVVYCFTATNVRLDGPLILDAAGDRDAVWIIHITGTLTVEHELRSWSSETATPATCSGGPAARRRSAQAARSSEISSRTRTSR